MGVRESSAKLRSNFVSVRVRILLKKVLTLSSRHNQKRKSALADFLFWLPVRKNGMMDDEFGKVCCRGMSERLTLKFSYIKMIICG